MLSLYAFRFIAVNEAWLEASVMLYRPRSSGMQTAQTQTV
jgi:hypothetical protein